MMIEQEWLPRLVNNITMVPKEAVKPIWMAPRMTPPLKHTNGRWNTATNSRSPIVAAKAISRCLMDGQHSASRWLAFDATSLDKT